MAISHVQPLLLLLLVSLFLFPTLGHDFQNCDSGAHLIEVTALDISPYPITSDGVLNFTITGNTKKAINDDGATVDLEISPNHYAEYSLCKVTRCPVALGPLKLTLSTIVPENIIFMRRALVTVSIPAVEQTMCIWFDIELDYYGEATV